MSSTLVASRVLPRTSLFLLFSATLFLVLHSDSLIFYLTSNFQTLLPFNVVVISRPNPRLRQQAFAFLSAWFHAYRWERGFFFSGMHRGSGSYALPRLNKEQKNSEENFKREREREIQRVAHDCFVNVLCSAREEICGATENKLEGPWYEIRWNRKNFRTKLGENWD